MKYEFVLTDKMKEDRFMCGKNDNICKECSCYMSEGDCVFNHLYVTAESPIEESQIETTFDAIKSMNLDTMAIILHSLPLEDKTITEIKELLKREKFPDKYSRKVTKISELLKIAKPKPCPFCGYWNISDGSYSTRYSCACMSCGARTQETETWKEAVELWNVGQFQNRKTQIEWG